MQIPFYKQNTDYTCGPASLQMVLTYLGKDVTQENLTELLGTHPDYGTDHEAMLDVANYFGVFGHAMQESSLSDIKSYIDRKIPVIANFIEPTTNEGHYAVVTGIDDECIRLHDPWNGENFKIPLLEFESRWYDTHTRKWLLAVSPLPMGSGQ